MPSKSPRRSDRRPTTRRRPWLERLEERTLLTAPGQLFPNLTPLPLSVPGATATVAGDFNGDGKADYLVVSNTSNVAMFLGNGDGTFQALAVDHTHVGDTFATGDFNGDGKLDLAFVGIGSTLALRLGNGDGTFQAPINVTLPSMGLNIVAGDFNGDGKLDVATTQFGQEVGQPGTVAVLLGNGDGTFQAPVMTDVFGTDSTLVVGDVNGDGKSDLVFGGYNTQVGILLGAGAGRFQPQTNVSLNAPPNGLALADLNGDGKPDLIATAGDITGAVDIYQGDGHGGFQAAATYVTSADSQAIVVADLNGDGKPDLVADAAFDDGASVLLNRGDGTFGVTTYNVEGDVVVAADYTGDGRPDLVFADTGFYFLKNHGDGTFDGSVKTVTDPAAAPDRIATGDVNGDGLPDLVVPQTADATISVLLNAGNGRFAAPVSYSAGAGVLPRRLVLADVNGDGILDIVSGDDASSDNRDLATVDVFLGNGDGTFRAPLNFSTPELNTDVLTVGDVNGDGKPDFIATQYNTGTVGVYLGNGDGTFAAPQFFSDGGAAEGTDVVLADLNGDGNADLVITGGGSRVAVLPGTGDGSFGTPIALTLPNGPDDAVTGVAVGQFTADGRPDLVVAGDYGAWAYVLVNQGNFQFQGSLITFPGVGFLGEYQTFGVAVADFNGDGNLDAAIGSGGPSFALIEGNGDGTFQPPAVYHAGRSGQYFAVADFDGDGRPDLAVADAFTFSRSVTLLESSATAQSATQTVATNASASFSNSSQTVTLYATVTSGGAGVTGGTVTFSLFQGGAAVGTPVTSVALAGGAATATYTLPAGLAVGTYEVRAVYNPGQGYLDSADTSHTLTVGTGSTTTAAANVNTPFSTAAQTVTLSATVTSGGNGVSGGTVTFTVFGTGHVQVGSPVTSGTVARGAATAGFTLPAGLAAGAYTIQAVYNPGTGFQGSSDTAHNLVVAQAATTTAAASAAVTFKPGTQSVTLTATVTGGGGVNEGSVTFTLLDAHGDIEGVPTTSGTVAGGLASVSYVVPAGLPAGTYTVQAHYNPGADYQGSTDTTHTLVVGAAATTTTAGNATAPFNIGGATISFVATVTSPAGVVNEGTVTFTVLNGSTVVGGPVSGSVSGGTASASTTLVAGLPLGTYTLRAAYADAAGDYQTSDNLAAPATATVTTAATTAGVPTLQIVDGVAPQPVTLQAQLTSAGGPVAGGFVTFVVLNGSTPIGGSVTSGPVAGGVATATFVVPANTPAGVYTIQATYGGSGGFQASAPTTGALKIDGPPTLPAINGTNTIVTPHDGSSPVTVPLNATSPVGNPLTYTTTVTGDSVLFDLQSQYQFTPVGVVTVAGTTAYVLKSPVPGPGVQGYYLVRPADGGLFAYDGSGSYSHTFTNTAPLAVLGANVFVDPNLLLNALPPADYTTLHNLEAQFHFVQASTGYITAGAAAYVLQASSNNSFGNKFYLIRPSDGALFPYDGSGSYLHTFQNVSPIATLGPQLYLHPQELLNALSAPALYAQLNQLQAQYDLQFNGSFMTNLYGHGAQWIYSPILNQFGQHWYTLILNPGGTTATLRAWEGYADSAVGAVIANLDASVYANPALLTTATFLPNPAAAASVDSNGNLIIGLPTGYTGTFKVGVTASDGLLATGETVTVNVTDAAPVVTVQQGATTIPAGGTQTVNHGTFPQTYTVTTSDADGDPVTTTVSVAPVSTLFSLQQRYQFKQAGVGHYVAGELAFVMTANGTNQFGNNFYLIRSDGGVYAYDGSGSYTHTFQNVTPIGNVGVAAYFDPALLFNAQPPVDYGRLAALEGQFHFLGAGSFPSTDAIAYKLQASTNNSFGNPFYVLTPDGSIYPLDATGTAAHSIANGTAVATVEPDVFVNPGLLINAVTPVGQYDQLFALEQRLDLQLKGSFMTGMLGSAAKWLYSPLPNSHGQNWYTLVLAPNGTQALLYAYDGGGDSIPAGAAPVAAVDASVYFNPYLLLTAQAPPAVSGVSATLSGTTLTVNAPANYVGGLQVTVTSTDGIKTTTQAYRLNVTDTPPAPTAVPPQAASASGSPLHLTLPSLPAVTYSATAQTVSAAYTLQQEYHFTGVGRFTTNGTTAYVLSSTVLGGVKGFYLVKSDGGVYAYDGGKDYATTFANPFNRVATLDPSVFSNPALLTSAAAPTALSGVVSVTGNTLTVNAAGLTPGTVFQVVLAAFDGAETTRASFLVTVTA